MKNNAHKRSGSAAGSLRRRIRFAGLGLLFAICFSFEARGDDDDSTDESDLSPGVNLRTLAVRRFARCHG